MKMNKKGFTLAELLIVVAIIGVLTVVAVPIFTAQLEKAREETDIGNLREAKAAAVAAYLAEETITDGSNSVQVGPSAKAVPAGGGTAVAATTSVLYWDVNKGALVPGVDACKPTGYGKGTTANGGCEKFAMNSAGSIFYVTDDAAKTSGGSDVCDVAGLVIKVTITNADGSYVMEWV